jgi:hypothetical protein
MFLEIKCKVLVFSQLKDENWKTDLALLVDIMGHLDNLSVILQGKDSHVHDSYTAVETFQTKLLLFSEQFEENKFTYFCSLQSRHVSFSAASENSDILLKLHEKFLSWISRFQENRK